MEEGAWSCFARLPPGLADQSITLTLNWLKPKPLPDEFELKPDEVEGQPRRRNLRMRALSIGMGALLALSLLTVTAIDVTGRVALFSQPQASVFGLWAAASMGLIAFTLFAQTSAAEARYRRAAPRRVAYEEAVRRFSVIAVWRRTRAKTAFWSSKLDEAGFEREVAELLAGHFKTGQVMVTRTVDDYGVDVLICAGRQRIVAQCKQWKGQRIGATDVRALAGAKAYFGADRALLVTLSGPTEDKLQCADIADAQNLELWDGAYIAAAARAMQDD
ncbi:MAG: restriction endonuclease [Alphaproteobacteria bacterium]|nr:restriction endonuclease [Alphaproteobacteria bacterium]